MKDRIEGSPSWEELGWRVSKDDDRATAYAGQYSAEDRKGEIVQFAGYVVVHKPHTEQVFGKVLQVGDITADVYIVDPPPQIKQHPSGSCFQFLREMENGRSIYTLHFNRPPRDVSTAISFMNNLLSAVLLPVMG